MVDARDSQQSRAPHISVLYTANPLSAENRAPVHKRNTSVRKMFSAASLRSVSSACVSETLSQHARRGVCWDLIWSNLVRAALQPPCREPVVSLLCGARRGVQGYLGFGHPFPLLQTPCDPPTRRLFAGSSTGAPPDRRARRASTGSPGRTSPSSPRLHLPRPCPPSLESILFERDDSFLLFFKNGQNA